MYISAFLFIPYLVVDLFILSFFISLNRFIQTLIYFLLILAKVVHTNTKPYKVRFRLDTALQSFKHRRFGEIEKEEWKQIHLLVQLELYSYLAQSATLVSFSTPTQISFKQKECQLSRYNCKNMKTELVEDPTGVIYIYINSHKAH